MARLMNSTNGFVRQQRTLAGPAVVRGFGYWSGRDVTVEFRPAAIDKGIVFVLHESTPASRIAAHVSHRVESPRRTTLAAQGARVEMVEHILAALSGLQIDNCEVWVDAPEMPGCDGSCLALVRALQEAGSVTQPAIRAVRVIAEPIRVCDDHGWIEARPGTAGQLSLQYRLDYGSQHAIGRQTYQGVITPTNFVQQLAPARTFLTAEEAQWLRGQGKGLRAGYQDLLVFGEDGPIDNELRFEDECVRHKALDLIGDLALAGCDLHGSIIAYRSGHRLNARLVRALLDECKLMQPYRRSA